MTLWNMPGDNSFWKARTNEEQTLIERMETSYTQGLTINQSFWAEADIDNRFKAGDQTLYNDIYGNIPSFRRRSFNFNRIRRVINMISGFQRRNRKSTICTPIENSDELTAKQFSKVLQWAMERDNTLLTISEAFEGALTTGMNLLAVWMDYRTDAINGNIVVDNVSYNGYLIDPFFKKVQDLSDCNYIWTRKWLTKTQAIALLPDRKNDIQTMQGNGNRDGRFQYMPESYNYGMQDLLVYDEYWYRDYRSQTMIVDIRTGETMEWKGSKEDLKLFMYKHRELTTIENQISTCKLGIVLQGNVMYLGSNPMGIDRMPFVPVYAYYEPQIPYFPQRVQGVVRGLRDAQFLYNRRKVIELDILESQINSGWKYKENALVNPADVFLSGQGRGLALKDEAQMTDVEKIQPAQIPPSMIELSKILADEIQQISGVNEELLGSATDDKAGVLGMLRQGAGLTTLNGIFDQLDGSQKQLGRIKLDLIQANFSPGKIQKIIGEKPAPQFYSKAFGVYDAAIEEGMNTTTQRQMKFNSILEFVQVLEAIKVPIPPEVIKQLYEVSPVDNVEQIMQSMQQKEQQQSQMQQQQMQMQMELQKAQINDMESRAVANKGLGLERGSRVQENRALAIEKLAEAEKDRDLGLYERVKAMKELEGMDLDHLNRLLQMSEYLKSANASHEQAEKDIVETPNTEELAVMAKEKPNG
jgi:hypothetical protein